MALSYNLGYQESISVHPTRRQNFAGKVYSNFPNIWEWLLLNFDFKHLTTFTSETTSFQEDLALAVTHVLEAKGNNDQAENVWKKNYFFALKKSHRGFN